MNEDSEPEPPSILGGVNHQDGNSEAPSFSLSSQTDGIAIKSHTLANNRSEIEELKQRISELEMRSQNDVGRPPLSPNVTSQGVEQGKTQSKQTNLEEQYKRMEECLYLHRKEWESEGGPSTWEMNEFLGKPAWRKQTHQYGPWKYLWEVTSAKNYERPDPFDRFHVCEAGHDKQDKTEYDEYDRTIDYGYRRERLRKNFEWDLDRLYLAEETERRRQHALIQKPKAADASSQKKKHSQGGDNEAVEEVSLIFYAVPDIKRLDWSAFKQLANSLEKDAHAIDVLVGEPIIEDNNLNQSLNLFDYQSRQHQKSDRLKDSKFAQDVTLGLLQLPERIRINSTILRKAMAKILGSDGQSLDDTGEGSVSVIFTRPFKAIAYCEPTLRKWHADLEKKHSSASMSNKEDSVVNNMSLSSQETPQATVIPSFSASNEDRGKDVPPDPLMDALNTESPDEAKQQKDENKKEGSAQSDADSLAALSHLKCILNFVDSDILSRKSALDGVQNHKAFFSDLWHLFRPGTEVIRSDGKQAYRVIRTSSTAHRFVNTRSWWEATSAQKRSPSFTLDCVYIDFDGTNLGPVYVQFSIKLFEGEKEVTSFAVYPLRFHRTKQADFSDSEWEQVQHLPNEEKFRQKLINRGAKFMSVIPMKHMYYSGLTLEARDEVESQVVIDFDLPAALDAQDDPTKPSKPENQKWKPKIQSVITKLTDPSEKGPNGDLGQQSCHGPCCYGEFVYDDTFVDQKEATEYIESLVPKTRAIDDHSSVAISPRPLKEVQADTSGVGSISNDELVIMSHRVFGFVLRSRKWAKLDLSYITDVHPSSISAESADNSIMEPKIDETESNTALDRLVLEDGHRNMIVSLITQHFREKESSRPQTEEFDIVKGKGKGLILLLHGAPGVGKTSTAEGVAELFQKPLLQITCGDLGSTAREVEEALETNFAMASKWGCILLLDEADIFLAERTREDYVRNGLVAVFLRTLEYYSGILFLTTNRVGDFDEAFTSRIHVSLYYPELDRKKTIQVFKLNLEMIEKRIAKKGKTIQLDKTDICMFAGEHFIKHEHARWNGRQIRNACQTALALAEFEAQGNNHKAAQTPNAVIKLEVSHFGVVQAAYLEFAKYMNDLYGTNAARRAKEAKLRALWELERNMNLMDKTSFMLGAQNQSQANPQQYPPAQQGFRPSNYQQQGFQQQSQPHGFSSNQFFEQQPPSHHQNPNMAMPQPLHSNAPHIHVQEELSAMRPWNSQSTRPFGAGGEDNTPRDHPQPTPIQHQQQQQQQQQQVSRAWMQESMQNMYEDTGYQSGAQAPDSYDRPAGNYSIGTTR